MAKSKLSFPSLIKATFRLFVPALKRSWRSLVALMVLRLGLEQYAVLASKVLLERGREEMGLLVFTSLLQFVLDLLWSGAWLLVVSRAANDILRARAVPTITAPSEAPATEFAPSFLRDYPQLLIEGIRTIAELIFRAPFLVIPALVEYVRLLFVPYVVLFDPAYKRGEVDALKQSRRLVRGRFVFLAVLLSAQPLFALFATALRGEDAFIWEMPLGGLLALASSFLIEFFFGILIYLAYRALSADGKPEAVAPSPLQV